MKQDEPFFVGISVEINIEFHRVQFSCLAETG